MCFQNRTFFRQGMKATPCAGTTSISQTPIQGWYRPDNKVKKWFEFAKGLIHKGQIILHAPLTMHCSMVRVGPMACMHDCTGRHAFVPDSHTSSIYPEHMCIFDNALVIRTVSLMGTFRCKVHSKWGSRWVTKRALTLWIHGQMFIFSVRILLKWSVKMAQFLHNQNFDHSIITPIQWKEIKYWQPAFCDHAAS